MLKDILYKVSIKAVHGNMEIAVNDLQTDSRKVSGGCCFIAIRGTAVDGHDFIETAIEKGAIAIICESMPVNPREHVTYVSVENSSIAAGLISHQFYGEPSGKFKLVGVTGTN